MLKIHVKNINIVKVKPGNTLKVMSKSYLGKFQVHARLIIIETIWLLFTKQM